MSDARRVWTPDDDGRLEAAVTALASSALPKQVCIWSAVCGRLAPELTCTPDSAKARYRRLVEIRRELAAEQERRQLAAELAAQVLRTEAQAEQLQAEEEERADRFPEAEPIDWWERTARLVEQHEQDQADRIEAAVERIEQQLCDVSADETPTVAERLCRVEDILARLLEMWQ